MVPFFARGEPGGVKAVVASGPISPFGEPNTMSTCASEPKLPVVIAANGLVLLSILEPRRGNGLHPVALRVAAAFIVVLAVHPLR